MKPGLWALVLLGVTAFLLSNVVSTTVAQPSITVPSGVPTQYPDIPVRVGVPDTILSITGCASPNALVHFFDNNKAVGTAVANSHGYFSKNITVLNAEAGIHDIKFFYDDVNGRTSSIVNKKIALGTQSITYYDILLPSTIEHEPEPVKIGENIIFRGSTCPYATVNVVINNNFGLTTTTNSHGNWYIVADTSDYYSGAHIYDVISKLPTLTSDKSSKYRFSTIGKSNLNNTNPNLSAPVILEPNDNYLSSSKNVTVSGTGPSNVSLEIFIDDQLQGSVFTNSIGEWSFILTMKRPQHSVKVRSCYLSKCGDFSNIVKINYSGQLTDCVLYFSLNKYRFYGLSSKQGIDLVLTTLDRSYTYSALLDWGDATLEHLNLTNDRLVKFHHVYELSGHFNGSISLTDDYGCSQTYYFTSQVDENNNLNWWMLLFIPIGGSMAWSVSKLVNVYRIDQKDSSKKSTLPRISHYPKPTYADDNNEPKNPKSHR